MRRKDRELSAEIACEILMNGEYGVLSLVDKNNKPYSIPISYAFDKDKNKIYLHSAKQGKKIDCISENNNASFVVVGSTKVQPQDFSTFYSSVIAHGTVTVETDEKEHGLREIIKKYSPDYIPEGDNYIKRAIESVLLYSISIDRMTAKGKLEESTSTS